MPQTIEDVRKAVIGKTITHVAEMYGLESSVFILDDNTVVGAFGSAGEGWFMLIDIEMHGWKLEDLKAQSSIAKANKHE